MGAYYTKEDITEYISKNTVSRSCSTPPGPSARWPLKIPTARPSGICSAKIPTATSIPPCATARTKTFRRKSPPASIAKADVIEARKAGTNPRPANTRCPPKSGAKSSPAGSVTRSQEETRRGEVREVNDFITLNLDLRQFAQDVIQNCEGPDLLMAFWQAITTITVLDPTGGSGAFIFAALNILEPLYEACLDRMEAFLAEWGDRRKSCTPTTRNSPKSSPAWTRTPTGATSS
jgi:hypothetical protein